MRKKFIVGTEGRIEGLSVIGFHGEVDLAQTPARREALFLDEEGRLIGLEEVEHCTTPEGVPTVHAIWGRVGPYSEPSLPGIATKLSHPIAAYLRHIVVILGRSEIHYVKELVAVAAGLSVTRLIELLKWLEHTTSKTGHMMSAQRLGDGVMWYCSPEDAFTLYQCISRVAERQMIRSSNDRDEFALYQASWWLSRAAIDDSDRYIAAVGMARSDRRMSDAYLRSTFRRRLPVEIEVGLRHARNVFDDRCEVSYLRDRDSEMHDMTQMPMVRPIPEQGDVLDIGKVLTRSRSRVRGHFLIRGHAA